MAVAEKDVGTCVNLISLMPLRKARPSLYTFFQNTQMLDIVFRSLMPNFIHTRPQIWKVQM
jgi:hypothetical protein